MKDFYQISLKAIIKNEKGKILCLKSLLNGSFAGYYDMPGGRVEDDEFNTPFTEILKREIVEEVGDISVELGEKPVTCGRHLMPARLTKTKEKDIQVLYLFFEAKYLGGEIKVSSEHIGFEWLDCKKENLSKLFTSAVLEGMRMYLK